MDIRFLIPFILTYLFICSCSNQEDPNSFCEDGQENIGSIELRLQNESEYDFADIFVDTSGGIHEYCNLEAGGMTGYKKFEKAYRYAFIELLIDDEIFTIQPIDYVGESLLASGKYTYLLDASDLDPRYSRLSIKLQVD